MSFAEDLLIILSSYNEAYRLMRRRIFGHTGPGLGPRQLPRAAASEATLRVTLSRLKQKGFVENDDRGVWRITVRGSAYAKKKLDRERARKAVARRPKDLIIAFDIPEKEAKKRWWLRARLKGLGFVLLQESLWFGPSPLPEDFIQDARRLRIIGYLKFFKATETDII